MNGDERTANLYELAGRFDAINRRIMEAGGEVTPEVDALLAELDEAEGSIHSKVDAIRRIRLRNMGEIEFYGDESRAYGARAQSFRRTNERLMDWVIRSMDRAGLEQAGLLIPQRIQDNGGRPQIEWVAVGRRIPTKFRKIVTTLDKDKAWQMLKAMGKLPKGFEVKRGRHLRDVNTARETDKAGEES
jgi:hypothetical protein